ncbi:MAG: hypothetical protein P1U56_18485 [Saprospiraceae bacterium]|nr:hypothetical protein [Saprospiraceae bacterium]
MRLRISLIGLLLLTILFSSYSLIRSSYKIKPLHLSYEQVIKEPIFHNLKMIGKVNKYGVTGSTKKEKLYGKILRTLRFQNISHKVEEKYNLPKNIILAMIMHETGGADLLPNGQNDGGLGLCHMQPSVASDFGLKIYKNSKKLKDKKLGVQLRKLIKNQKYDRKKLIEYDDRFHPILNIDAVGRMLADYKYPKIKGLNSEYASAVYRYSGKYNFRTYWRNVKYFMKKLNDQSVLKDVEKVFNSKNKNLLVDHVRSDFKGYIKAHQDQNINYGLDLYK